MPETMPSYFDHYATLPLPIGTEAWRVYWTKYGPLAAHPHPDGRMALVQDEPPGTHGRGGIYLASTPAGVFWEVVLRNRVPSAGGLITLPPGELAGRSIVKLRSTVAIDRVDLTLPARRNLFDSVAAFNAKAPLWQLVLEGANHGPSHAAAAALERAARLARAPFAGCTWLSKQDQRAQVHLFYEPPYLASQWEVMDDPIALDGAKGKAMLSEALAKVGMRLAEPLGLEFDGEDDDPMLTPYPAA